MQIVETFVEDIPSEAAPLCSLVIVRIPVHNWDNGGRLPFRLPLRPLPFMHLVSFEFLTPIVKYYIYHLMCWKLGKRGSGILEIESLPIVV